MFFRFDLLDPWPADNQAPLGIKLGAINLFNLLLRHNLFDHFFYFNDSQSFLLLKLLDVSNLGYGVIRFIEPVPALRSPGFFKQAFIGIEIDGGRQNINQLG
jgi:hypothetical protein